MSGKRRARVLLGASGSISVVNLPVYLAGLRSLNVEVQAALTPAAETFLPASTLAHLAPIATGGHVELARWADLFVILPCTANTLSCVANGAAPNPLTTAALAHRRPLMLFPAMNADMWRAPAVRRNVGLAEADGHRVVPPVPTQVFEVASGTVVEGIAPPPAETFVELVKDELRSRFGLRTSA